MTMGNASEHLPFDVLGHIFSYYTFEENIKYPLETLLLVCKSWSHAALGHRRLWSNLRIYLGHEPTSTIWTARLPLRLARCGPDIPLDVDLRNLLDIDTYQGRVEIARKNLIPIHLCNRREFVLDEDGIEDCSCDIAATVCTIVCLQALTGSNGEICARWRSLTLHLGRSQYDEVRIALSHATPILENLDLGNVRFREEDTNLHLFPQVHSLKWLSLLECELPSLPSCDNLLGVSLCWEDCGAYQDFSSLRRAQKLRSLSLRTFFDLNIRQPAQLPDLRVLKLGGIIPVDQTDIFNCQMPQISHLSLEYDGYNLLDQMLRCGGLPIEKLTRLSLGVEFNVIQVEDEVPSLMDSLRAFLTRARDLQHLDASGHFVSLVIKALWNFQTDLANPNLVRLGDSAGPAFKDVCLTNTNRGCRDSVQINGSENTLFLEELAIKWRCLAPNLPDELFVQRMIGNYLYHHS